MVKAYIINTPSKKTPETPKGVRDNSQDLGKPISQVAFEQQNAKVMEKIKESNFLVTVLIMVLVVCFITLFYGYWQFASTSFNDYSQKVKELNDIRYKNLENKMNEMEKKYATDSAK